MKNLHRTWGLAAMACALLIAACSSSGPGTTVQAFARALANGDADTATSLMYLGAEDSMKAGLAKGLIGIAVQAAKATTDARGGLDSVEINTVDKSDDSHATVNYTVHFGNGDTKQNRVKLTLHDGKWLITP